MGNKLKTVFNKETGERGWMYKGVIFTFYEESDTPEIIPLDPILLWLDNQDDEFIKSLAHVMVDFDVDDGVINIFFKEEAQTWVGKIPRGYTIEIFENFPNGCDTTGKLWRNYARDSWQYHKPLNWDTLRQKYS